MRSLRSTSIMHMNYRHVLEWSCALAGLVASCGTLGSHEVDYWVGRELHGVGLLQADDQEGEWTYRYPNGQIAKQGRYEDDKQVGKLTLWHPNGAKEQEGYFTDDGFRGGPWTYWNADGSKFAEGCYQDGREHGGWKFHGAGGVLHCAGEFNAGRRAGEWRYYHPAGGLQAVGLYLDGRKIGTWRYFASSGADAGSEQHAVHSDLGWVQEERSAGSLKRTGMVCDGRAEGRWTTWHPGGQRKLGGEFIDGRPTGIWIAHSADGSLVAMGRVAKGACVGDWLVFEAGAMRAVDASELQGVGREAESRARPALPDPTEVVQERSDNSVDVRSWLGEMAAPWTMSAVRPLLQAEGGERLAHELTAATERKPEAPIAAAPITRSEVLQAPRLVEYYAWGDQIHVGERVETDAYGSSQKLGKTLAGWRGRTPSVRRFIGPDMSVLDLDRMTDKPVLLVILRGMPGRGREVCIYCNMQVKAYAARAAELASSCTLVVVYPGPLAQLAALQEAYALLSPEESEIPFLLVADVDETLVRELGIEAHLAVPTTLLLDRAGRVVWTYCGLRDEDRPTVATLLRELHDLEP